MNTSLKVKEKFFPRFHDMMMKQLKGGGKRYALGEDKEFTDLVCEAGGEHGTNWIGQNIIKYVGEIINARLAGKEPQEVNFVKIAVYAGLWWIKTMDTGFTQEDRGESTK